MRVLWLTPGFAAGEDDYNCIPPMQALARALLRHGTDLHIIALEYPFRNGVYAWETATVYPCNGQNRRFLRWRTLARARGLARQIMQEKKAAVLHSFWLGPASALGGQLAGQWQIPHWTTLMGQDVLPGNRYLRRLNAPGTARLVALTAFHNNMLTQNTGLQAAQCIPWGLEQQDIPQKLSSERVVDVLGVGSLIPVKNWELWLRVLRLVANRHPRLRAELIGSGPEERRLRALTAELGLEKHVHFAGELPRPEVLARMGASRILLHTSRFESFGMVLVEAAAQGCRVISTPVGVAPELGLCAAKEEELATAVVTALKNPPQQVPELRWQMEAIAEAYLDLYRRADA